MPDVRIDVYADTHGAPKNIKDVDDALDKVAGTAGKADGASGGLWKQFAFGQIAVNALKKAYDALKGVVEDSIKNALGQEKAENDLKAALEITGRTVDGNLKHYLDFAAAQMKVTTYTDDEIEASQALLLQLTRLDQQGVDRATKGAMGLATVMGMDLHGATVMVTKAMEGNFGALGRVGIKVAENLTVEQKQASLLDQLEKLYQRSTKETDTFGGSLKQLKNSWGEVLETTGTAIIKNETLQKAVKDLKEWTDKLASSPDFQLWLNTVIDGLVKAAELTGKFAMGCRDLMMNVFGATKADKELADAQVKLNAALDRAAAAGHNYRERMDAIRAAAEKLKPKIDEVGTGTHTLTAEEIKAAEAKKKLAATAQNLLDKYLPLLGAMNKLKEEEKTLTDARNKGAMSASAYSLAMAANAKAQRDVGLEAGKTAKAQGEMVKAAQDIINRYNPMHAAMVKAIDDEKKLNAAFGDGKNPKAYAKGLENIHKDLDAVADAEKKAKAEAGGFTTSISLIITKLQQMGVNTKSATAAQKALIAMLMMGRISARQYAAVMAELDKQLAASQGATKWAATTIGKIEQVCAAAQIGISAIEAAMQQSLTNKLAMLDDEYQARLDLINNSVMNEEEKEAAITALDAEYNMKRRQAEVEAAKKAKVIAIAMAIINVAEGVTKALSALPPPFNIALAAITAAAGAIQIALIRSQPIGAAKGAIFKQKALLMSQTTGQEYEVAEGGEAEIVSSPRQLREAIMGRGAGERGNFVNLTFNIHAFDGADVESSVRRKVVPLLQRMMKNELFLVHPRAVRTY
jgi:phage terminase small subunit